MRDKFVGHASSKKEFDMGRRLHRKEVEKELNRFFISSWGRGRP